MKTKEKIKVMQAYLDGKKIEVRRYNMSEYTPITIEPSWSWGDRTYRIMEEPEYIPFDFTDANLLVGVMIKNKGNGTISLISEVGLDYVYIGGRRDFPYQKLFDDYVFLNGDVCGKQSAS